MNYIINMNYVIKFDIIDASLIIIYIINIKISPIIEKAANTVRNM